MKPLSTKVNIIAYLFEFRAVILFYFPEKRLKNVSQLPPTLAFLHRLSAVYSVQFCIIKNAQPYSYFIEKIAQTTLNKHKMKKDKIIYWAATGIVFLFDTVMPALTSHTELAKQGIARLGYPDYFRIQLTVFKIIGGLLLVLPFVPSRYKEWAYVGFGISFISAFIGHGVVDGFTNGQTLFPLVIFGVLTISYVYYHKLLQYKEAGLYSVRA